MCESQMTVNSTMQTHPLNCNWCIWTHLPHDTDWSLNSYTNLFTCKTLEEAIAISNVLPSKVIQNCMLFIMREGITPLWEDPQNKEGGCFSYKLSNKAIYESWQKLTYSLVGENLSNNEKLQSQINGITVSPKKNFCIIKIWLSSCEFQDASSITCKDAIDHHGCLFKKHNPEFEMK